NDKERAGLAAAARPAAERLARKEICFLGMWSVRKGSRDWSQIVHAILNSMPDARFAFLGTMTDEQTVLRDLDLSPRESIRWLTSYEPKELPELIAACAGGLFLNYIGGFGIAVIGPIVAGIPKISYLVSVPLR